MATEEVDNGAAASMVRSAHFERFAGACAILTGLAGFMYAVAFVVLQDTWLSGLFLMLGGLLTITALVAVYERGCGRPMPRSPYWHCCWVWRAA